MIKSIEVTGPNIDAATRNALNQLDLDRDSVTVEVLAKEKSGFFGFGSAPAKVKVSYEVPDEVKMKKPKQQVYKKPEVSKVESAEPKKEKKVEAPTEEKSYKNAEGDALKAKKFIEELLTKMGIESQVFEESDSVSDHIKLDITGKDMGAVIGRRGDTLDAIQYITSLYINKDREEHVRVSVNTENYRAKREESLQKLANKMANKALKYKRNMTLEPMNPYERRIIHSALQEVEGVSTFSTGSEPNRRVVIAVEGGSRGYNKRRQNRYPRNNASKEE